MGLFHSLLLIGTRPRNSLEEALLSFLKERTSLESFLDVLHESGVCVLIRNEPGDVVSEMPLRPLVMDGASGYPAVCVFTSPERSKPFARRLPEYGTLLEIEFRTVLASTPGLGVLINPGTMFSMEGSAQGMNELRAR